MVDTWATVGSCAQIGKLPPVGGVGIGGVLEPMQAKPVIIEDDCFIGARSEVVEGVVVEEGCVIVMGVFITASTPIIGRTSGEVFTGRVPAYSVVVPGNWPGRPLPDGSPGPSTYCAIDHEASRRRNTGDDFDQRCFCATDDRLAKLRSCSPDPCASFLSSR